MEAAARPGDDLPETTRRFGTPWVAHLAERPAGDHTRGYERAPTFRSVVRVRVIVGSLAVVALAYIEGLSHSEIASRMGLPLGTVKSRMRIAYQKVRAALEDLE